MSARARIAAFAALLAAIFAAAAFAGAAVDPSAGDDRSGEHGRGPAVLVFTHSRHTSAR